MSLDILTAVRPITYPARPINGGSLEAALPKPGQWLYEPKYNGWRALVHAPTGVMFNRYGGLLSIAALFSRALNRLRTTTVIAGGRPVEWFDCEALARRHPLGRGTLLVFDYVSPTGCEEPLHRRKEVLAEALVVHTYTEPPLREQAYGVQAHDPASNAPETFYRELQQLNARWGCLFYEGVVAKRTRDPYPVQLRSASQEFVGWVKHRWAY